jgi:predicted DsbA family dithiol-disulfide isomerase
VSTAAPKRVCVRVHYDFASSLCYVAHRAMERLMGAHASDGISLAWSPVDLTLLTGWRRGAELGAERRANVARVSRELSVPLVMPGVWLDSRPAHAVAVSLAGERAEAWREAVFASIYQAGRAPDADLVAELARELSIDAGPAVQERGREELVRLTRAAGDLGVAGVPSFVLGEWPIAGIQCDATMLSMLSRWAARQREAAR